MSSGNFCFTCLNCGRQNPVKSSGIISKYCNNKCQAEHRSRSLVKEWKEHETTTAWRQVPDYVKKYLISSRGHKCEICGGSEWQGHEIPLVVDHWDHNTHNNEESNLAIICPNCRSQR